MHLFQPLKHENRNAKLLRGNFSGLYGHQRLTPDAEKIVREEVS